MFDRLAELRRQRALVHEHLGWLDREIADAAGKSSPVSSEPAAIAPGSPAPAPALSVPVPAIAVVAAALKAGAGAATLGGALTTSAAESPLVAAAADSILDEYRVPPDALRTDVRKGCFVYFAGALLVFALGVVALYFALRHR